MSRPRLKPEALLTVAGVVMSYPGSDQPALCGLDFAIAGGEAYGLLGPNGAGKTTTISILATLIRPTAGNIQLAGVDLLRQPAEVRKKIGLVPQDIALYPDLTARENLLFFGRLYGLEQDRLSERVESCLKLVSLQPHAEKRIASFSGGMKRRANLAVGLLHQPQLLILDEPTVGIDAQSRSLILESLAELKRQGATLLYTTHYMEEAQLLCDRVGIIDHGRLVAEGEPAALIAGQVNCRNLEDVFLHLTGRQLRD
jgi:ABC-2 type transport system ATP-binding protein